MTQDEQVLFDRLRQSANAQGSGHLTVMKFTTNWRVSFSTPNDRKDIDAMAVGKTFEEAALAALEKFGRP